MTPMAKRRERQIDAGGQWPRDDKERARRNAIMREKPYASKGRQRTNATRGETLFASEIRRKTISA